MVRVNLFVSLLVLFASLVASVPPPKPVGILPPIAWPLHAMIDIHPVPSPGVRDYNLRYHLVLRRDHTLHASFGVWPFVHWTPFDNTLNYSIVFPGSQSSGLKFKDSDTKFQLTFFGGKPSSLLYHIGGDYDEDWTCGDTCLATKF